MNENRNDTVKWLQYLMYAAIAAMVNSLLSIFGLDGVSRWVGLAVNVATVYLLLMLSGSNSRYKTAAIFYAVALASGLISNSIVALVGSVCGIVAQYQEYHAHGELIEEKDPKLADRWNSLFGMQIVVSLVITLLSTVLLTGLMAAEMDEDIITFLTVAIVAAAALLMDLLYIRYLKKTIALMEA